ncbi:MAG: endoribonuclease YicC domain-containing protein, partial [Candidatus Aminicenantia bacterium]
GKMIDIIERLVKKIEKRESIQKEIINKKIKRNMRIIGRLKKVEDFPKEELFLFLRKMDLAEEIARIKIHINEFKNCVIKNEPVGKKLEFLCLEIQREVTSILSKSEEAKISSLCVEIKDYTEKIKEQLRNIE